MYTYIRIQCFCSSTNAVLHDFSAKVCTYVGTCNTLVCTVYISVYNLYFYVCTLDKVQLVWKCVVTIVGTYIHTYICDSTYFMCIIGI